MMQIRDKFITAVCRTAEGIEWTILKIKPEGPELVEQDGKPVDFGATPEENSLSSFALPPALAEKFKGDITVALRSTELLLRTTDLPSVATAEIAGMIGFQIDKISPFPSDQLAMSHEILRQNADTSTVLMAAARRSSIDAIGDALESSGVRVHSIDARVLGWLQLMADAGKIPEQGCAIFVIHDAIDFTLVVVCDAIPLAFRMLHSQPDDPELVQELVDVIGHTLASLDAERDVPNPTEILFWTFVTPPNATISLLQKTSGLRVHPHDLGLLPPLSEGIIRRAQRAGTRLELIPREWIEHEKRKQLQRQGIRWASAVTAVWLSVLLIFLGIYKVRDMRFNRTKARADEIAPAARKALENRLKLKTLKTYTDRSDSALECLREITRLLPVGDIEFASYNYNKDKGVTLRGTANSDDTVYSFLEALASSTLFDQLKDQSVNATTTKDERRAVYSITLVLPPEEVAP